MIKNNDWYILNIMCQEGTKFERILSYLGTSGSEKDITIIKKAWPNIWGKFEKKFNKRKILK
jgi:hypothetical protein